MKWLWLIVILILLVLGVGLAYLCFGWYDISAVRPHRKITLAILNEVRERSIAFHSRNVKVPPSIDDSSVGTGYKLFEENCRLCHGTRREEFARGLYPSPPFLASKDIQSMNDREIFWAIKNGIKMTGMPAFGIKHKDDELWGVVNTVRSLSPVK